MNHWFRSLSLSTKQVMIIILINGFSLLLASAWYFYDNFNNFQKAQLLQLESKAEVIAGTLTSSLLFHDIHAAHSQLQSLSQDKNILYVAVYDETRSFFTNYESRQHFVRPKIEDYLPGVYSHPDYIELVHEISYDDDLIGYLYLIEDTSSIKQQMLRHGYITIAVFVFSLLIAYLLSIFLQRLISKPIKDLANTMDRITTQKDYSVRMLSQSKDEIGQLIQGFNIMLDAIKQRDDKLRTHGEELEDLVNLRTRQLHQRSNYDALTKLPNRHLFIEQLEHQLYHTELPKEQLAVLFLDLDRFKIINDNLGHEVGDEVLRIIAQRLIDIVDNQNAVARWGGDEFVIYQRFTKQVELDQLIERIHTEIAKLVHLANREFHVSTSIGVSLYPQHGKDALSLLKNADISVYRGKQHGVSSTCYYNEGMSSGALDRLTLETKLRYAIENKLLKLVYQPKINIKKQTLAGVEALIRWDDPDLGTVSPGQFIPLAEEIGVINKISDFVLETVCKQHALWRAQGLDPIKIAINLPPSSLAENDIVNKITKTLSFYRIEPSYLELEITEETFLDGSSLCLKHLEILHDAGFNIAIDDFGTGYSSLSYLLDLPVSTLKIDGSFIRQIGVSPQNDGIVNAIMTLGHGLGLEVVAECVETEQQLSFLKKHNCDIIQGYLFSQALDADALAHYSKQFHS